MADSRGLGTSCQQFPSALRIFATSPAIIRHSRADAKKCKLALREPPSSCEPASRLIPLRLYFRLRDPLMLVLGFWGSGDD